MVAGGEGFGRVAHVGKNVKGLKVGDWVIPALNMAGTWTTQFGTEEKNLVKVS